MEQLQLLQGSICYQAGGSMSYSWIDFHLIFTEGTY